MSANRNVIKETKPRNVCVVQAATEPQYGNKNVCISSSLQDERCRTAATAPSRKAQNQVNSQRTKTGHAAVTVRGGAAVVK